MSIEETDKTIVIGGGQAGLAAGYFLARHGSSFAILDESTRTGDAWRRRWDSLRLFTPSQFNGLPGLPFPGATNYFPTKNEAADYLETYAARFHLPVEHGLRIDSLRHDGRLFQLVSGQAGFSARNVVIAAGASHTPFTPAFSHALDPGIQQMHSSCYQNAAQVPANKVLVVGAGNSGIEIGLELARAGKQVWLAGRDVGQIPADKVGKILGGRPYWWFLTHVLSIDTPIGRKMKAQVIHHGNPHLRSGRKDAIEAGIHIVPRVASIQDGQPRLEDGSSLPVEAVIWSTGFRPDYRWVNLPIFDQEGFPRHQRGVATEAAGLYFLGLHFQTGLSSALLGGVGADAAYITGRLVAN